MRPPDRGWTWRRAPDGRLAVRHQGLPARLEVVAAAGAPAPSWAAALRAAAEAAEAGAPAGARVVRSADGRCAWGAAPVRRRVDGAPVPPVRRVLFFESLMNAELPHNDGELSQGVLHLASSLTVRGVGVDFADVKMAIHGEARPVQGLDSLGAALARGPYELVCITLLEGYWEGVVSLVRTLRELGCRAHVAVGGVFPTLAPDVVAAHLPDATFVCRGAGEAVLPALAQLLGPGANIDLPLDEAQVAAALVLDGVVVRDAAAGRLIIANSAAVPEVPDLDAVPLDLGLLQARHFATGVELASSRGCVHRCVFCSILGRERYQARSAEGLVGLLARYRARLAELFGPDVPRQARRLHFADDDFACDKARAVAFLGALPATGFRLASVQVSVGDLCRREAGTLLPEPDPELFAALRPELFDDADRPIPDVDFVADHRSRRWSSYLQIGVEAFSDVELVRLAKGYKREHVRAVVHALAERGIHHDAYYILANRDTTLTDFVAGLDEVVRLKTLFPTHFHLRFPVVGRLVSYATSASWRRRVQHGDTEAFALRGELVDADHPEYDYPLVDHDVPRDPHVAAFVDGDVLTDAEHYAGTYARLRDRVVAAWRQAPTPALELAARTLDDRGRRRLFQCLDLARRAAHDDPGDPEAPTNLDASPALRAAAAGKAERLRAVCEARLGPADGWLPAFQRFTMGGVTRLVMIPTWQCELRCNYCTIPKQDGRVMSVAVAERGVDLLLSSERRALTLQFFGGEALLEWALVRHTIAHATARAAAVGKAVDFVLSSNGWSLDQEKLDWLRGRPVKLELSLDGDPDAQRRFRPAARQGDDSYAHSVAAMAGPIGASGLAHDVIMVVHPDRVERLAANYLHIVDCGFTRVQINFALGKLWSAAQRRAFADQLFLLAGALRERPHVVLVNAEHRPMPMRLNAEVTLDWDGTIYGGNAFLHETEHKARFRRGHLDELGNFDRYWMDAPKNQELVDWSYGRVVTENNLKVGAVMTDFLRWYRGDPRP